MATTPTPPTARWHIIPLETPAARRRCPRCDRPRWFRSSDRFRVNANGRRLDAWLIYRCTTCDATWNRPVAERADVRGLDPELLRRWTDNDRPTAWSVAFDVAGLRRLGAAVDAAVPVRVERDGDHPRIRLELAYPCELRLDRLLSTELGISRSALQRLASAGRLQVEPAHRRPLRRPVRHGQVIVLEDSGVRMSEIEGKRQKGGARPRRCPPARCSPACA